MTPETAGEILIYSLPLVTAGVTFALTIGGIYLNSKYQHSKLVQALIVLDNLVIDVVAELNRTVVEDLKKANADGKLTKDEADQIKSKAIDLVLKRLGTDMIRIMQKSLGSVIELIAAKIEAAVFDHKKKNFAKRKKSIPVSKNYLAI